MRMIGLLGGMSWESTREYYRIINEGIRDAKGGLHSAPLLLHSFDFAEIAALQHNGQWDALGNQMAQAAQGLERAGAGAIMICTNLMHKVSPHVQRAIAIPLLHIADAVAAAIKADGNRTVALLGTSYTMQEPFYRERIAQHGIETIVPEGSDAEGVSRIIYEELCQGKFLPDSRRYYLQVMDRLKVRGAQGVILGCTEIPQLIGPNDCDVALYDTTTLHAKSGLDWMLSHGVEPLRAAS